VRPSILGNALGYRTIAEANTSLILRRITFPHYLSEATAKVQARR
jgi:hypothetical protein